MPAHELGGRRDRDSRLKNRHAGPSRSISSDMLFLASQIYKLAKEEAARSPDGNSSKWVFAGIPLLISSIYAFIIECESFGHLEPPMVSPGAALPQILKEQYGLSGSLLEDFACVCEIRNEIIHPTPLPTGTPDNWPNYLRRVKDKKLLVTHDNPDSHYLFFDQMSSVELFAWAVWVAREVYKKIIDSKPDHAALLQFFLTTFASFA